MPGIGLFPHETDRGRAADDRRRPARVPSSSRASGGRSPASRTTPAGRGSTPARSRSAASSPASGTTASRATRAPASAARSGRTCTGRSCRAIRGSQTGCSPRRWRTRPAASRLSSSRCRTGSRPRRTRCQRNEPETAAAASRIAPADRSTSSPRRPEAGDRDSHRGAALPICSSEPARAVGLDAADDLTRRLVVVAEADEHLVEDDVVQDLDARLRAEEHLRRLARGRSSGRRARRRRCGPASEAQPRLRSRVLAATTRDPVGGAAAVGALEVARRDGHRVAVRLRVAAEDDAAVVRDVQPLVRIRRPRVCALAAHCEMPEARARARPESERAVDVEPGAGGGARVRNLVERVDGSGVHVPGLGTDDHRAGRARQRTRSASARIRP